MYSPVTAALQDIAAVPEPMMSVGVIKPQVSPDGRTAVMATVALNPLRASILIVDVSRALPAPVGDDTSILKSTKLKVAVVVCVSESLSPVNVRLYSPAFVALQDTVAIPDPLT